MNNQKNSPFSIKALIKKRYLVLVQFFIIIFVYHLLKDMKDSLVITSSDAGAKVIPFIKIWAMLPVTVAASYLFTRLYRSFGREKTLYWIVGTLLVFYGVFAFCLFPSREELYLDRVADYLETVLPIGCQGFIAMVRYWVLTVFYVSAELWSVMVLSVLFWGYLNDTTPIEESKHFYPICIFTANCAGILSGQTSRFMCQFFVHYSSWQIALQCMVTLVIVCGIVIMYLNRRLDHTAPSKPLVEKKSLSFKESVLMIFQSFPLLCIAMIVVGFGFTSNLIEVVWKGCIKDVHVTPHAYNAYINQLTSIIGATAVVGAFASRWAFQKYSWSKIALVTPVVLFTTGTAFFLSMLFSQSEYFVMTLGSVYYVSATVAKYTIFDTCKEMAFLSFNKEERIKAKAVIDSVGSRLGKSGASSMHQVLLISFAASAAYIPVIAITAILIIGFTIFSTRKLGDYLTGAVVAH